MKAALWSAALSAIVVAAVIYGWLAFMPLAHAGVPCLGQVGVASFYSYTGHRTASGEAFSGAGMTAASRTLPFGVHVRVTLLASGRSVIVRINDRGPFVRGRIIDLSRAAAQRLGLPGIGRVCVEKVS